jgi:hypothetical protein
MFEIARSNAARVTAFGPSFATMSFTARPKSSPAENATAPKPSALGSNFRIVSRVALWPLSSNGSTLVQMYWPSTADPPSLRSRRS